MFTPDRMVVGGMGLVPADFRPVKPKRRGVGDVETRREVPHVRHRPTRIPGAIARHRVRAFDKL